METVEIEYDKVQARTDASVLFEIDGVKIWIPKSLIEDDGQDWEGEAHGDDAAEGPGTLHVASWFADREGLA